jgi:hypothetical protein
MADTEYKSKIESYAQGRDPVAIQRDTPVLLKKLISGVPAEKLQARPAPEKWSIGEIIAHLAEDEISASWRYRQMLENPGVLLAGFDQDKWATLGDYRYWDVNESIEMLRLMRNANIRLFERLTPEQWKSHGVHAERGPTTVEGLVRHMAGHDLNHLEQIRRILGS